MSVNPSGDADPLAHRRKSLVVKLLVGKSGVSPGTLGSNQSESRIPFTFWSKKNLTGRDAERAEKKMAHGFEPLLHRHSGFFLCVLGASAVQTL